VVKKSLKPILTSGLFILLSFCSGNFSQARDIVVLTQGLEKTFNTNNKSELFNLFSEEIARGLRQQYDAFLKDFPNATWNIKFLKELPDQRKLLEIIVQGTKYGNGQNYNLISKQQIVISISNGKVVKKETFSDYSILKSGNKMLNVTVQIPDRVLTGSIYDIDIILEEPLEDSIIAGGLIAINDSKLRGNNSHKDIELMPLGSGGIFKSARAPLNPGEQRWAALIAHPQGLISITKKVKIVSSSSELRP